MVASCPSHWDVRERSENTTGEGAESFVGGPRKYVAPYGVVHEKKCTSETEAKPHDFGEKSVVWGGPRK
jgi:hypothetical protein